MHAMVGLFALNAGGRRDELIAASDDPGIVAEAAARMAAGGDRVAREFLTRCVRDAAELRDTPAPRGTGDE